MVKAESIEDFYINKVKQLPDNLNKDIGHFNVFRLDGFVGCNAQPMPYNRKDFFKISLIIGPSEVHYADKTVIVNKQCLLFANPHIPYNWDPLQENQTGFFCVFTEAFFHQFGNLKDYPLFKPGTVPVFELSDEQVKAFSAIYLKMFDELASDFAYKHDVIRNLVFELIHSALKMPSAATSIPATTSNASRRISSLFLELLDRQFPIESANQRLSFRSASDFASQLSVHVNHLNRALKETTQKTTSEIIAERIMQEAKVLLKHTNWNISEIAYSLGFEEPAHFSSFFKKQLQLSPGQFRLV